MSGPLAVLGGWPAVTAAAAFDADGEELEVWGPTDRPFRWASVTKLLTALCIWVGVEEGSVAWDDPAGPSGSTLGDLMCHASGLAPDSDDVLAAPRARRIYSNRGIEVAAGHLETSSGMAFGDYLREGVLDPLGLSTTRVEGSPAHGASGPLLDLLAVGRELIAPTLVSPETAGRATTVAVPGLAGVLPGFGRQDENDWGLGPEIRGHKRPHWTGSGNSPGTFGHFGQAGGFLWVDRARGVGLACLSDQPFGPWAATAWPSLSDTVLDAYG